MTKRRSTKRALLSSVVALLLCFSMLLGSTFAWFTDSVVSANNVITAGNLDIDVQYTLDGENWKSLDGAQDLFKKGLWEPGHTEVVALKIENKGSLALKYAANMNIVNETFGKTKDNSDIKLSEILTVSTLVQQANDEMGIGEIARMLAFASENGIRYENTALFKDANVLREDVELHPGVSHYMIVKVDMAETVGNEANHNGTNIPEINFGINVLATQYTYENDSFGNQYDKDAEYPTLPKNWDGTLDKSWFDADIAAAATPENPVEFTVDTAEEFFGFINLANTNSFKNVTVKLACDIDMSGQNYNTGGSIAAYSPAFSGTLDGCGHTISNMTASNSWTYANALFRSIGNDATIKNLVFDNVDINNAAGASKNKEYAILVGIVGGGTLNIENVTVKNSKVEAKSSAGILVGGMTEGAIYFKDITIENCDVVVESEGELGAALLGNGWSHHDYDYAGVFTENVSVKDCTYTVGGVLQSELPLYNYVK